MAKHRASIAAALVLGLALGAGFPVASAAAQAPQVAADNDTPERLTVKGQGVDVRVWVRRPAEPKAAILFVHGRTWSSLPNFDLDVPGQDVSVLKNFAARGFAAYAMDLPGYGETPRGASGLLAADEAAADVRAVLREIEAREKVKPVLVGYSRGSQVALLTAATYPDGQSALVLYGFPGLPSITAPPATAIARRTPTTATQAASDFLVPGIAPGIVEAYVQAALKSDPVRMDWDREALFAAIDPARVTTPTLLLQGVADPVAGFERQAGVFAKLGTPSKAWTILADADHAAHLERSRAWADAIVDFVELNAAP